MEGEEIEEKEVVARGRRVGIERDEAKEGE